MSSKYSDAVQILINLWPAHHWDISPKYFYSMLGGVYTKLLDHVLTWCVQFSVTNESEFGVKFQRQHANYGKVIWNCSLKIEINVNFLEFLVITYQKTTHCFKFARKAQPINQMSFAFEAYSLNKAITFKQLNVKLYYHIYIFLLIARLYVEKIKIMWTN